MILTFWGATWCFLYFGRDRLRQYRDVLGLEKANLVFAENYQKVRDLILPTRESVFSKNEPVIWIYRQNGIELFLGANQKGDIRMWLEPPSVLREVHIVLDSTSNNALMSNLDGKKLPKQQITLEGGFSKHFKLYCNEGQQIIALQIIAPDIMAYLLDNLLQADVEILDGQVAIISKGGARSLQRLKASIELAQRINTLCGAVTKVTSL